MVSKKERKKNKEEKKESFSLFQLTTNESTMMMVGFRWWEIILGAEDSFHSCRRLHPPPPPPSSAFPTAGVKLEIWWVPLCYDIDVCVCLCRLSTCVYNYLAHISPACSCVLIHRPSTLATAKQREAKPTISGKKERERERKKSRSKNISSFILFISLGRL